MPFYAVIALFAIFTLFSCGGGGGGSGLTTISGKFVASYVKGLRVCVKGTNNCAFTNQNGEYSLSVNTSSVIFNKNKMHRKVSSVFFFYGNAD